MSCLLRILVASLALPSLLIAAPNALDSREKAFHALLTEEWEHELKSHPEMATELGDYRYNDRLSDVSLQHSAKNAEVTKSFLKRFKSIDTKGFGEQDILSHELIIRGLEDQLKQIDLKLNLMMIDQFNGIHLLMTQFVSVIPFRNVKDYEDYLARLNQYPHFFDSVIEVLRQGLKDRMMPPKFLLEKCVTQIQAIHEPAGLESPFAQPVAKFPKNVSEADQKRLRASILDAIDHKVRPAFAKLQDFVAKDYAPHGRTEPGIWSLPNGDAIYAFLVEHFTTTKKTPADLHELGLSEVARIEAEQIKIAKELGYKSLADMRDGVKKDKKYYATSRNQILDLCRKYVAQMEPKLPQYFGMLPPYKLEVLPVETFREKEAAFAEYFSGTPDGKRPGRVMVNTGDFEHRLLINMETTAYHEGVPGHHMQISIAQNLHDLPKFRQNAEYNAYVEGWALYAEHLAKEMGFYQDRVNLYGHLSDELLRADRLVLDTGVHLKHWTREQMVDYFHTHGSQDEPTVQSETDRYIAWAGQALAYKTGQIKILELREKAKKVMGKKFDIRRFHDEILNAGALPLDVLEKRMDAWMMAK